MCMSSSTQSGVTPLRSDGEELASRLVRRGLDAERAAEPTKADAHRRLVVDDGDPEGSRLLVHGHYASTLNSREWNDVRVVGQTDGSALTGAVGRRKLTDAPDPLLVLGPDTTAVRVDDRARDRQPEPQPFGLRRHERLEQVLDQRVGNSRAGVPDREADMCPRRPTR